MKIALAEDNPRIAHMLQQNINGTGKASIVQHFKNGREILQAMQKGMICDIILMDIQMPEMDGIEATKRIMKDFPSSRIIMCTVFDDDKHIFEAILAGAKGYLLKEEQPHKMIQAFEDIMEGGSALSPSIALKALQMVKNGPKDTVTQDFGLTQREMEILQLISSGLSTERTADNLKISAGTIRKHTENIYRKLGVNNRVEAVITAQKNNLVD
jgi:DNA-binding NarL/FixJ family response regulator